MPKASHKTGGLPEIYDDHICDCGEGPLWHPERKQLYWVDVTNHIVLTRENDQTRKIPFGEFVTALSWIDKDHILAATETALVKLNLNTFEKTLLSPLEAGNPQTRSNDGRADPWGGFWISTMGRNAEENAGKIYRFYNGKLTTVIDAITIANAICFDKAKGRAYFADTATQKLYCLDLNKETGVPTTPPRLFVDFSIGGHYIDGAIVDTDGQLWLGVWDGHAVMKVSPEGIILDRLPTGADRPTCPAFGGLDYTDLYVTTAAIGLEETFGDVPRQGKTLVFRNIARGQAEPQFKMDGLTA